MAAAVPGQAVEVGSAPRPPSLGSGGRWTGARGAGWRTAPAPVATCVVVPAAASTAVRDHLVGPPLAGSVLGAFPTAVYIETQRGVLAVLTRDAYRLPIGLVLPATSADAALPSLPAGAPVNVGNGEIRLGGVTVCAARWWQPARPKKRPSGSGGELAARLDQLEALPAAGPLRLPADLAARTRALAAALAHADEVAAIDAARRLVGLGPGLTPAGDDVLEGVLLGLRWLGGDHPAAARLGRAVTADAHRSTTALSAALLREATRGRAAPQAIAVIDALCGLRGVAATAAPLLGVGHSSGHDLARGLLAAGWAVLGRRKRCDDPGPRRGRPPSPPGNEAGR